MRRRALTRVLAILALSSLIVAWAAPFAYAARKRVTYVGAVPPGWTKTDAPTDKPEYVGLEFKKTIRDSGGTIVAEGYVVAIHNWWQSSGTTQQFADSRRKNIDDAQSGNETVVSPSGVGVTNIGGGEFGYYKLWVVPAEPDWARRARMIEEYYCPLSDGSEVLVKVIVSAAKIEDFDAISREAGQIFAGLKYDFVIDPKPAEKGSPPVAPPAGTVPWQVAVGADAVAIAAAAVAAIALASTGRKTKIDPNEPVGYVLELSTARMQLATANSEPLTVRVWRVLGTGRTEPADEARVTIAAPTGVQVSPAEGGWQHEASVWQDGDVQGAAALVVHATAAKGAREARVELVLEASSELVMTVEPPGRALKPNGKDVARVVATLKLSPTALADPAVNAETARGSIAFAQPTAADWLDVGKPVDVPNGKAIPIAASPPDPDHPGKPPESVTVAATAAVGEQTLRGSVTLPLERPPAIDARPDLVEFPADTKQQADVLVWIEDPGGVEWTFSSKWREGSRPLALVDMRRETASSATFTLTEDAAKLPDDGRPEDAATLVITGSGEGWDPIQRYIKVIVAREGVFIDQLGRNADGTFHVLADGKAKPTEIDFRVFVRDAEGAVHADDKLAAAVEITPADEKDSRPRNAAEVAGVAFAYKSMRPSNSPSATWRCTAKNAIPGDVPVLVVRYTVSVPGQIDEEKFAKPLTIGMVPSQNAPGGPDWQLELDRCKEVILEFVPLSYQGKLLDILDRRSRALGADGLAEMRHRIWGIAQDLTLGEGGQGYLEEGKWAGRIETVLDYAQWAGDIAFHAATAHFVGPYYAFGAAQLKQLVVSAIVAYEDNLTPTDWLWQNVGSLPGLLEGQIIDVDKFQKLTGDSKVKAWALFVAYHFFKNYLYEKKSFTDSLIEAGRAARDEAIAAWLGAEIRRSGAPKPVDVQKPKQPPATAPGPATPDGTPGSRPVRPPDGTPGSRPVRPPDGTQPAPGAPKPPETKPGVKPPAKPAKPVKPAGGPTADGAQTPPGAPKPPETKPGVKPPAKTTKPAKPTKAPPVKETHKPTDAQKRPADAIRETMKRGPDGKPIADEGTTLEIMRDPTAVRKLKDAPSEVKQAFNNARKQIYDRHRERLIAEIKRNHPELAGKDIDVVEVRTPGKKIGPDDINTDHDFRVVEKRTGPDGKPQLIEVDRRAWEDSSNRIFAEETKAPPGTDPAQWARDHGETPTDRFHTEASADYSDQHLVAEVGPDGKTRAVVHQGPSTIEQMKSGQNVRLKDPEGFARMWDGKVHDAQQAGHPAEAFAQAGKAADCMDTVQKAYDRQRLKVPGAAPDPDFERALAAVRKAGANSTDPAAIADAQQTLRDCGYKDLGGFMNQMTSRFEAFKWAK
ncbi:MAG TPA: hypothetical protein VF902_08960 [Coriobacteriia bacterium]